MPQRYLTQGERWLCRHVFGGSIPMDHVEVISRKAISGGFTPYGRINLDEFLYAEDFIGESLSAPIEPFASVHHFLHEMAHSWQHFTGIMVVDSYRRAAKDARELLASQGLRRLDHSKDDWSQLKFNAMYSYDITAGSDLTHFTMEQQCEIIADYYALTLWGWTNPNSKHFGHAIPTQLQLEGVLTNFRANPGYPRDKRRMNELRARHRAAMAHL
jgi:hypothetical protein